MRGEIRAERRQIIVDAAMDLFLKFGYKKTSLEEVAEAAGVGKATLYHYFKGKSSLFSAVMKNLIKHYLSSLTDALAREERAQDKLRCYGSHLISQHRRFSSTFIDSVKSDNELPMQIHSHLIGVAKLEQELITEILVQGVKAGEFAAMDPTRVAFLILGSFRAMIIHARNSDGNENEIVEDFIKIIFNGILHSDNKEATRQTSTDKGMPT